MRYTAIADVSQMLVDIIKDSLVPELIDKPDMIGLCSPAKTADFSLGIYLYNIDNSDGIRMSGIQNMGLNRQKYPPVALDLYYMITPYLKGDPKFLAKEELTLLGKIVQTINDNPTMLASGGEEVILEFINPNIEDKQKIWNFQTPYITSVFAAARAVMVESLREKEITRVTGISINTGIKQ